jgi:hypothetical protein
MLGTLCCVYVKAGGGVWGFYFGVVGKLIDFEDIVD